jgi:Tachylectin
MALDHLGSPLTDSYSIVGGQARLFERGAVINGPTGEVMLTFDFPLIGAPGIATGDPSAATPLSPYAITFQIDFSGWADFKFLLAGPDQTLYAVDQDGQLLLFDTSQTVGGVIADPTVIGFSGWADFKFLLAGPNQTLYAVD